MKPAFLPPRLIKAKVKYQHENGERIRTTPLVLKTKSLKPSQVRTLLQLTARNKEKQG